MPMHSLRMGSLVIPPVILLHLIILLSPWAKGKSCFKNQSQQERECHDTHEIFSPPQIWSERAGDFFLLDNLCRNKGVLSVITQWAAVWSGTTSWPPSHLGQVGESQFYYPENLSINTAAGYKRKPMPPSIKVSHVELQTCSGVSGVQ